MSADNRGPTEDEYTALFAAAEEELAAGREPGPPAGAPPELQSRLERDLALARLLRQALGRPTSPGPGTPLALPAALDAAPAPGPAQVNLALPGGAEAVTELRPLLWRRLRFSSLCLLTVHAYFTVTALHITLGDVSAVPLKDWLYFAATWVVFLVTLGVAILLRRRPSLSLGTLRALELVLFGLALLDWTRMFFWAVFISDQLVQVHTWGTSIGNAEGMLCFFAAAWTMPYIFLIIGYATVIPSGWRRCTAVVSVFALTPVVIATAAAGRVLPFLPVYLLYFLLPMVMCLALIVAIAAYGTHRIEMLRQEAAEARKLGRYQLKRLLGAGGMGEVYLAEHVLLKQPCAIKLIRPERAGDPANLRRFEREVQATARLKHFNTVQIYDYGHAADGTFYYAMEFLPGLTLEQIVKRHGPLPPERAVHVLRQMCRALREAHAAGLIHRDLKPANVMLCERGGASDVVKVLDFGLVKAVGPAAPDDPLTREGTLAGTPDYMSPEQAACRDDLDARSDLYCLGAVAYFLLTGQPPFPRDKAMHTILAHLNEPARPPAELRPGIPDDLQRVVLACLEKDPGARFPDAGRLEQALAACGCAAGWTEESAARWWEEHREEPAGSRP